MSNNSYKKKQGCDRKQKMSYREAKRLQGWLKERGTEQFIYFCKFCAGYHLTSKKSDNCLSF